jgi:hypothetical protein
MPTVIVSAVVIALVALAIYTIRRDRASGGCSGDCSSCGGCAHHKN